MNQLGKQSGRFLTPFCLLAIPGMAAVAMFPVWCNLYSIASHDEEASHLFLVPVVFGWLLWCFRDRLQTAPVVQNAWGFGWIGVGIVCHEIGLEYNFQVLWHASAVLCLIGAICLVIGMQAVRQIWPTIAVLLFLIPIPGLLRQQISLPLQLWSASVTEQFLNLVGTDVQRAGCVLTVDGTVVTVAEACNGMRMLFAVLLVVYAMAFSLTSRRSAQAMILIASPVLAMLLNVLRLSISVWMFGSCIEETAVLWHDINGWLIPGALMLAVIFLTDQSEPAKTESLTQPSNHFRAPRIGHVLIAITLFCVGFAQNVNRVPDQMQTELHRIRVKNQLTEFPFCVGDWLGVPGTMHQEELGLLKPEAAFRREYSHVETGEKLSVVAVFTGNARDLVGHEPGVCFSGQGWEVLRQSPVAWNDGDIPVSGRDYLFRYENAPENRKQVISVLLVAGGHSSGEMKLVADAAADFRLAPFGACTLQISSDKIRSEAEWTRITRQFVFEMQPIINTFAACQTTTTHTSAVTVESGATGPFSHSTASRRIPNGRN